MDPYRATRVLTATTAVLGTTALLAACTGSSTPSPKPSAGSATPTSSASTATALAGLPPAQILTKALAAAEAAGSVHFTATERSSSGGGTDNQYAAADSGTQVSTYTSGASATFLLVGGVGYLRGNASALAELFRGKPVSSLVGKWIATHPGDPGYEDVTNGMTLGSALTEFTPTGTLTTTGLKTIQGKAVIGVKGVAPPNIAVPEGQPAILYVMATGQPLPVSFQAGAGVDQETTTFSRWGDVEHPVAPANPLPITSVVSS
jgi:hypothetical protein